MKSVALLIGFLLCGIIIALIIVFSVLQGIEYMVGRKIDPQKKKYYLIFGTFLWLIAELISLIIK